MYQPLSQPPNTDGFGSLTSVVGEFDSFDTRGIHPITRHRIRNDIPGAKAEAGIRIG